MNEASMDNRKRSQGDAIRHLSRRSHGPGRVGQDQTRDFERAAAHSNLHDAGLGARHGTNREAVR